MRSPQMLAVLVAVGGMVAAGCSNALSNNGTAPAYAMSSAGEGEEASRRAHLDLRIIREELLAVDKSFADLAAGSPAVDGLTAPLAEDAVFVLGTGYVIGAAAVRTALEANPINLQAVWRWTTVRGDVSSDGRQGYTYGYTELELPTGQVLPGKYLAYWRRQADGSWRMAAFKRVGRPAGPVSLVPPQGFGTPDSKHRRTFPHADPATLDQALRELDSAFSSRAAAAGTDQAFREFAAEDGAALAGLVEIAYGPEQVGQAYEPYPAGSLIWAPERSAVAVSGDLGFTSGTFQVRQQESDGTWTTVQTGKYLTIWQRQADGRWRFVIDG